MSRLDDAFADYATHHRTRGNKWCHRFGIPMIMISLLGLLARADLPTTVSHANAATFLIAIATIYYLFLEWRLALPMLAVSLGFYWIGLLAPLAVNAGLFTGGWVLQFVGHGVFEKKSPAFLRNLAHLLIGPLWILNDLIHITPAAAHTSDPAGGDFPGGPS